jgi:cobalt-zinc-cadmium efflux system outer membrane protein
MKHPQSGRPLGLLYILLALPLAGLEGQDSTTLQLDEVLRLAGEHSPRLRAAQERVKATRAMEPGAGLIPDPMFQVGVMNLAIPEFSPTMPASMAPAFQATQRLPLAGKLSLRGEMARETTGIDMASAEEAWWEVRTDAATAFYRIYEVERQLEVMRETLGLLREFETVARSMYSAGRGTQADVLRANVEVARMEAEIARVTSKRTAAASRLNAVLDRPGETPVPSPILPPLPEGVPDRSVLKEWSLESRPLLRGIRGELDRAATRRELAHKEIWPDLTIGVQYGFGRMAGDYKGMGGASVGFTVPIFAGRRQLKARDEATAVEGMVRARLEQAEATVDARITEVLADLEQGRTLIRLYREDILPQARAAVESSLSSYRVGAVDFMALVDAQMAANRFEGEYFGLLASYGTSVAELEMTIGRDLPVTDELAVEEE